MKVKLDDGKNKECSTCKREITVNMCESHSHDNGSFYCHLKKDHIVEWETKEEDKK